MSKKKQNTQNNYPFDALTKVAIIGDSSVGKTNILMRYISSSYQPNHVITIGIDFKVKTLNLDGYKLKMQLWDTAGQQKFRNLTGTIYKGAQAIVLVYSIVNRKSFENVNVWVKDLTQNAKNDIILALVGNKVDLDKQRQISRQEGLQMAKKSNAFLFMQTSAKQGINIQELFEKIGRKIRDKISLPNPSKKQNLLNKLQNKLGKVKSMQSFDEKTNKNPTKIKLSDKSKEKKNCSC